MNNIAGQTAAQVRSLLTAAAQKAIADGALKDAPLPDFAVETPADTSHGDYAANLAMVGARTFGMAPRQIAQAVCERLDLAGSFFERWEIAGPGFINLFVDKRWFCRIVQGILEDGEAYGRSDFGQGKRIMVEFVSANPTGPMHIGNARGGAIGDCLAAVLDWAGYEVSREFYVNDAGNQIERFALSLEARYLQIFRGEDAVEFPEDGYHGQDIRDHAAAFAAQEGDRFVESDPQARRDALVAFALPKNIERMKADLAAYRITYDHWFLESGLHNDGSLKETLQTLTDRGMTYEKDGALWYKATEMGGEKDEVLVRANGFPTYFAADIAYHYNKLAVRGYDKAINVWGADHHGHVARLQGAMDAVGLSGKRLDIVLMQLVRLMREGAPVKMSKRTGQAITLADLIEEVPVDAARFFFNMREPNSTLDFDLDLAAQQSSQNPVYYVQYAHARICSILKNMAAEGVAPRACTATELELMAQPEETELIRRLGQLPGEIIEAAQNYDPARLTRYTIDIATLFHKFYNNCRVKCEDEALSQARLNLCVATRIVLRNTLGLLKIASPEAM